MLNYEYNDLMPYISPRTLLIHYNNHYLKYKENLNKLVMTDDLVKLISEYVSRMTKDDVNNFAHKNGIILNNYELSLIFNNIKENWHTIVYGNARGILDDVKSKVEPLTYQKIENLYIYFKDKFKSYL